MGASFRRVFLALTPSHVEHAALLHQLAGIVSLLFLRRARLWRCALVVLIGIVTILWLVVGLHPGAQQQG